jgi:hypothetical protein
MKLDIIDLPVGETVTEPGLYRTPLEYYHTQLCDSPSISSSGLREVLKCPQYFWRFSNLNPEAYSRATSSAMTFGSAAHALILGDEVFEDRFVISPYDSFRTKEAREWKALMLESGKEVMTEKDMITIAEMSKHLAREPIIKAGLLDGQTEVSMIWQDRETGIWLKARPDLLPASGFLSDLKTTTKAEPMACFYKTDEMRYDLQMALGAMGLRELLGLETSGCALLYVENKEPFMSYVQEIPIEDLALAEIEVRSAIDTFAVCLQTNDWPSYPEGTYKHRSNRNQND